MIKIGYHFIIYLKHVFMFLPYVLYIFKKVHPLSQIDSFNDLNFT